MSEQTLQVESVKIEDIFIDQDWNCRGKIVAMEVQELADDIKKNGLMQPVVVSTPCEDDDLPEGKKFKLIAGFRRTLAHQLINVEYVPAVIKEKVSNKQALCINLSENVNRQDLTLLQEAKAVKKMYDTGMTQETIQDKLGKSNLWIYVRLSLMKCTPEVQDAADKGLINQRQVMTIAKMKKEDQLISLRKVKEALEKGEKATNIANKPKKPGRTEKVARSKQDIHDMILHIVSHTGSNIASRALAWSQGNISDDDFYKVMAELEGWVDPEDEEEGDKPWYSKYED